MASNHITRVFSSCSIAEQGVEVALETQFMDEVNDDQIIELLLSKSGEPEVGGWIFAFEDNFSGENSMF